MSKNILVVDDDQNILGIVKEFLEFKFPKCSIRTASTVCEAVRIILDFRIDLVISDYEIDSETRTGGDEVTKAAKTKNPDTMVMVCSGALSAKYEEIMKCKADFYLEKPFNINGFATEVERLLTVPEPVAA